MLGQLAPGPVQPLEHDDVVAGGREVDGRSQTADPGTHHHDGAHQRLRRQAAAVTAPMPMPPTSPTPGSPKNTTNPIVLITAHHV